MSKYIVVNIGCIECGVSSNIVGVFSDKARADQVAEDCNNRLSWREGGQNDYQVFDLPDPDVIAAEYIERMEE